MEPVELTQEEQKVLAALKDSLGEAITGHAKFADQLSIFITSDSVFEAAELLREHLGFDLLCDICGVDWIKCPEQRFELIYNFYSIPQNFRFLLRTTLPDGETPTIRSIQSIYSGADWLEREVYDMLGIMFEGHPDLRRIITPDGLEGWPHRKDFPLMYEAPRFSYNKNTPPEIIK